MNLMSTENICNITAKNTEMTTNKMKYKRVP